MLPGRLNMAGHRKTLEEQDLELEQDIEAKKKRRASVQAKIKKRNRDRDTRRKILTGAFAEKESRSNAEARALMERVIRSHILERDKYVFPELFPDARPPQRPEYQIKDAEAERAELN